jgi:hypothetical protein
MANDSAAMTDYGAKCDWVRARLPLWVSDRASGTDGNGEGGDLSSVEHQKIERHLDHCAACCCHRTDLARALAALSAVAVDPSLEPQPTSLWPVLARRIQDSRQPAPSRWAGVVPTLSNIMVRCLRSLASDQSARRAWVRDSLQAMFTRRVHEQLGSRRMGGLVLGAGLVASLCFFLITVPGVWREWSTAQSTIQQNAFPLANRIVLPEERVVEPRTDPTPSDDSETQHELVQVDTTRPVESVRGGTTSGAEPKPAAHPRFGYDLEHGIPMPPDARESKSVY